MEYVMFRTLVSKAVVLSLLVLLVGVGIATVSDVGLNFVGCIYAVAAILATVMGQIFTKSTQQSLKLDHMQLLHHASPIVFSGMFMMAPIFDDVFPPATTLTDESLVTKIKQRQITAYVLGLIFASCVFALGVNISNYMVIGQTSPITYQVVGHFKTMLVLVGGWLYFDKETNSKNLLGVAIAVVGMIWYSHIKQKEAMLQKEKTAKQIEMTDPPKVVASTSNCLSSNQPKDTTHTTQRRPTYIHTHKHIYRTTRQKHPLRMNTAPRPGRDVYLSLCDVSTRR
jgi:drug/metabolite transporter (DMT)-like permease